MTEEQAKWLQSVVKDGPYDLHADTVDPREFLTLHMDGESARTVSNALAMLEGDDVVDGLREIVGEWIEATSPPESPLDD